MGETPHANLSLFTLQVRIKIIIILNTAFYWENLFILYGPWLIYQCITRIYISLKIINSVFGRIATFPR